MNTIKIAMIARPNLYSVPGGDTIQINETAKELIKLGVCVDIITNNQIEYKKYNLLHFFNIIDPEDIVGHVLKSKIPYVVSTIYVDYREYDKLHRKDVLGFISKILPRDTIEYLKTLAKFLFKNEKVNSRKFFIYGHKKSIQYIIKHAACLLPNSQNEYNRLTKDYKIEQNYAIIPNAVNTHLFQEIKNTQRDIVLCVGRIEGRKNQLNVIKALKNTKYKVVFIGADSPNQKKYVEACKAEATDNITFIDFISQKELVSYYNRAKVHVLASWFETTGLSNLEAGLMGCNLVVANKGDVKDYFKELVFYCDPENVSSIKNAIDIAWNAPITNTLQQYILDNYTWDVAAKKTETTYKTILNI